MKTSKFTVNCDLIIPFFHTFAAQFKFGGLTMNSKSIGFLKTHESASPSRFEEVSPQYVSKILSGKVNFSFKSIAELEEKLGLKLMNILEV